jgi:hypothetical protein
MPDAKLRRRKTGLRFSLEKEKIYLGSEAIIFGFGTISAERVWRRPLNDCQDAKIKIL